ncbi:MAG: hypothetical protein KAW61_07715 [candidate division Zixibacteria bacterium]|nr:hypothetical protein [candidate division Zixibacteria bacterium]
MEIQRSAAILLSRQPLRPSGADAWVKQTRNAILWVKANSLALHSSIGMQTWELITALTSSEGIPLKLLIPAPTEEEYREMRRVALKQFHLDEENVTFRALLPDEGEVYDKHKFMQERDRLIVRNADVLLPLSIRPDGQMSGLLAEGREEGKPIIGSWKVEYETREESLGYSIRDEHLTDEIRRCGDEYLIHWTRGSNGPWPTEDAIDYYQAIARSKSYPRSGFDTLCSIVGKRRIVASSRNMPEHTPTVSFSCLPPRELAGLITWRARRRLMSFEPYGIGLEREYASKLGIQPVRYYNRDSDRPSDVPVWLTQSSGVKSDWRQEREYRYKGDFDFSVIPKDRLICFTRTRDQATQLQDATGIRTIGFTA